MQLSLPAATFPTPAAAPSCGVKTPATSTTSTESADTPADSFDALLSKDQPQDKDDSAGDDAANPGAEQAAGIMAALLWMPIPPAANTVPVLPEPTLAAATSAVSEDEGLTDLAGIDGTGRNVFEAPCTALTSSRAFASLISLEQVAAPSVPSADPAATDLINTSHDPVAADSPPAADAAPTAPSVPAVAVETDTPVLAEVATATVAPGLSRAMTAIEKSRTGAPTKVAATKLSEVFAKISGRTKPLGKDTEISTGATVPTDVTSTDAVEATPAGEVSVTSIPVSAINDGALISKKSALQTPQEKFASQSPVSDDASETAAKLTEKYFLQPLQKAVTATAASVGIAVAKVNAAMSASTSARSKSAPLVEPAASFVFSAEAAPTATFTLDAPAPVATVRETLAAVISAVDAMERRADIQQKSVDLQFHVGNEKLGLRVELKDGAVHTTFRTESPEMNHALAREWHSLVPTGFGREIKLADPVFNTVATSGSDSSSTSLGQGAQQQREQQKAPPTFTSALKREFYDSSVQETAAPAASTATNSSQLLNVLA